MKIKIIFIDIDGTIRSDKKRISLKTRYIIKKLTKKGIIIVICSGRNRNFTKNISLKCHASNYIISSNGADIYNQMPYKMKDGCVYPKGLPKVLQEYGLCAKYYSGNLKALQNEVCKGTPVIVMIRVRNDKNWLHYVPVVGFDDRYVFVAESLPELVNCNCKYYNRRIEKKFFFAALEYGNVKTTTF